MKSPEEVTLYDVYEQLGGLNAGMLQLIASKADHEKRIRSLEVVRNWAAGVGATVTAIGGFLIGRH